MTSPTSAATELLQPALQGAAGLTLRDLVETTPEAVTDGWCRQLAASLLRAVETQQAERGPHRIIMPDTVVVHAHGAAALLSSLDDDDQFQPPVAVDIKAIAAVLHFAITGESPPGAPLLSRGLTGFGDDLLGAIDVCLHGDRLLRPPTIAAMRESLGLPAETPPLQAAADPVEHAAPAAPLTVADELEAAIAGLAAAVGVLETEAQAAQTPVAAPVRKPARMSLPLLACLAVGILGATGFFVYEKGRQAGTQAVIAAVPAPAPAPVLAVGVPAPAPPVAEIAAPASVVEPAAAEVEAPVKTAAVVPASVTYKLSIKPWGEVYVDGVKRGISPPLKTLTLSGAHTVRIDNPDFPSRTIDIGKNNVTRIEHAFQ